MNRSTNIPANGALATEVTGPFRYLIFRSVTTACQYSFDGSTWLPCTPNDNLGPINPNPTRIYFRSVTGLVSVVNFEYGQTPFSQQNVDARVAPTYLFGNAGNFVLPAVPTAKNGIPLWSYNTNSAPTNLISQGIVLRGINNGHARKQVTIQNTKLPLAGPNTTPLYVFDSTGRPFIYIEANNIPYTWESSDDFYLMGYGAAIAAGCVITNEIFYQGS